MRQNNRKIGTFYEQKAGEYLESQGYQILEYNYRCRRGEIDIIARDGAYLVFCEVKYRKQTTAGNPLEAVTVRKQKIISQCALYYIVTHHLEHQPCRFDVVGVLADDITLIQNAFEYAG